MSNEQTVREVYAAFLQGDVDAITALVSEDVDWNNDRVASRECPWNGNFSGRAKLPGFFAAVAESLDISTFEVQSVVASGSHVAAFVHLDSKVRKNGKAFNSDVAHSWSFNDQGQIIRYRHYNDTAAELNAWRG